MGGLLCVSLEIYFAGTVPLSAGDAKDCRIALADIRNAGDRLVLASVLASLLNVQNLIECDPPDCWAAAACHIHVRSRPVPLYMHLRSRESGRKPYEEGGGLRWWK